MLSKRFVWLITTTLISISLLKILLPLLSIPEEDLIYKSLSRIEKLEGDYTFAVMGDNKNSISTFGKMIEMINKDPEIAFVVNTGDMVFLSNRPPRQSHQRNLQRNTTLLYDLGWITHSLHYKEWFLAML
ncbi:MAG: hypothetical protein J7L52_06190 [Thermotogae bacterium]|nr:hypothetical protein [Thermotogota bacterium]